MLVVKHITCNTKVGEIISFCDFFQKNYAGSSKNTPTTRGYLRNWRQCPSCLGLSYPYIHRIFTLLWIKQIFEKIKSSKVGSKSRLKFWPGYNKPLREIENEPIIIQKTSVKLDSSRIFLWLLSSNLMENLRQYTSKQQIWKTLSKFLFVISCTIFVN